MPKPAYKPGRTPRITVRTRRPKTSKPASATPRGQFSPRNPGGTRPNPLFYRLPGSAGSAAQRADAARRNPVTTPASTNRGPNPLTFPANPGSLVIASAEKIREAINGRGRRRGR